ncbi:MAG: DUF2252 domain-containing protein [Planctomycetaceae bacterium]
MAEAPAPEAAPRRPLPRPQERARQGKEARARLAREDHGWDPPSGRLDPVAVLQEQSASRIPELVPIRYGRMLASPLAFYRGAAAIMAADLGSLPDTGIVVQLAGDAHLSNYGGFASPERDLVFDLNDFDETLPGPWEWDLKRLVASCAIVGRERGLSASQRRSVVLATVARYRDAMWAFTSMSNLRLWYERLDVAALLRRIEEEAGKKQRRVLEQAARKGERKDSLRALNRLTRVVDGERRIVSDPPLLVPAADLASPEEFSAQIQHIGQALRAYRRSLQKDRRHLLDEYRVVDLARKVVGIGSVGTRDWIVLLLGLDDDDPLFLQFKESDPSVLAPFRPRSRHANEGQRVVEGQRLMQATSDIFLGWDRVVGLDGATHDFYARQLWDSKVSPNVDAFGPKGLRIYAEACAWTLARAHARSGDRVTIAAYLGTNDAAAEALCGFAEAYADQNDRDLEALRRAAAEGRVKAETDM